MPSARPSSERAKTNSPPLHLKDAHTCGNRRIEVCISWLGMAIAIIALILWENPVKQPLGTVTEVLELFVQLQGFYFFGIRPRSEGFGGNVLLKVFGKQINILDRVSKFSFLLFFPSGPSKCYKR